MNELQKRFSKKVLSPLQKQFIIEGTQQPRKTMNLVPVVVSMFIVVATLLLFTTLNGQTPTQTTAATKSPIVSMNYFLNTCNYLLIIGICMHIVKLMNDGTWRLRKKWAGIIPKTAAIWIIVLIIAYAVVGSYIGLDTLYKEIMFALLLAMLLTLYSVFPSTSIVGERAIANPKLLVVALIGLTASFIISWTIDPLDKINATATVMDFPTDVNWEPYNIGKFGALLFVLGMLAVFVSLLKYRAITIALLLFVYYAVPGTITYVQQAFYAQHAGAIYSYNDGRCHYESDMQGTVDYHCEVTLKNRSHEAATFSLEIHEPRPDLDYATIAAVNANGPFTYTLEAKETRKIVIEGQLAMGHLPAEQQLYMGTTSFYLKIFDDDAAYYK